MITTKNLSNYLIECLEKKSQAQLPSNTIPNFSLSDAYSIALEIKGKREKKEEKVAGIKVGFTNKTIWNKYSDPPMLLRLILSFPPSIENHRNFFYLNQYPSLPNTYLQLNQRVWHGHQ